MCPSLFLRNDMQQSITAQLKLIPTPEQALRAMQLASCDARNAVSVSAFEQSKTSSLTKRHKGMYAAWRARYGLPSQLACSVERQVGATAKGLWTQAKKHAEYRRKKMTGTHFTRLDTPPTYRSPTLQRDYTFKPDQQISPGTLNGRICVSYEGYDKQRAQDAKRWYDRRKQQCHLLVSLEIEVAEPTPHQLSEVVGRDVGTRGAKRRIRRMEQRERRLNALANHCIATQISTQHPHALRGLEHLTAIRECTQRKRKKNGNGTERVSQKACKANRVVFC